MIDTHAHLQFDAFDADRADVVGRMRAAGVDAAVIIGCDLASSEGAIAMADQYGALYATVGVHPNDCADFAPSTVENLRTLAQHDRVVAIGETGLDYYRDRTTPEQQQRAFEAQAELALELDLPLVVHNRDAHEDVMQTLERFAPRNLRAVLHCFSGDETFALRAIDAGLVLSFAGPVSYPKNATLRAVAATVPQDRYVIETDCPFLSPQPRRGKRNEPAHVAFVAETIAEARGIDVAHVHRQSTHNARRLFRLPGVDQEATA